MADISKKYVGQNLVLASGTLIVRPNEIAWIVPLPTVANALTIQIEFEDNILFPAQIETTATAQPHITKVLIRNFTNPQGTVCVGPTNVGSIGGRKVLLDVVVQHFSIGHGLLPSFLKSLSYTVTIAGMADV